MDSQLIHLVKESVDIVSYIGRFVQLKKSGAYYVGLSPFKPERTPSFTVTPSIGIFKCFATGKSGDVITFAQEHQNLPFNEAVLALANEAGISLPTQNQPLEASPEQKVAYINDLYSRYTVTRLKNSESAISYLKSRGISGESCKLFQIGYVPGGDEFFQIATGRGIPTDTLLLSGLCKMSADSGHPFDFFRQRLMFPIHSPSGKIVGFAGRSLASTKPKYLNTSLSPLYQKSQTLFGLFHGREAIRAKKRLLLVEGYLDVVTLHQHGVKHVAAISGTAFTSEQASIIKQFCEEVIFVFDGDSAGQGAAFKSIPTAVNAGLKVGVIHLPEPYDPDEFVNKYGAEAFATLESEALSGSDAMAGFIQHKPEWTDPALRLKITLEAIENLSVIANKMVRTAFIKSLSTKLDIDSADLLRHDARLEWRKKNPYQHHDIILPSVHEEEEFPPYEVELMKLNLRHREIFLFVAQNNNADIFSNAFLRDVFSSMIEMERIGQQIDLQSPEAVRILEFPNQDHLFVRLERCEKPMVQAKNLLFQLRLALVSRKHYQTTLAIYAAEDSAERSRLMELLKTIETTQKRFSELTPGMMFLD
jgi:DNA primase